MGEDICEERMGRVLFGHLIARVTVVLDGGEFHCA